jgi:hypothetical protein
MKTSSGTGGGTVVGTIAGMRRVSYVEVVDEGGALRFYAVGVGHRRPVAVPISRSAAAELAGKVRFVERSTCSTDRQVPMSLQPVD